MYDAHLRAEVSSHLIRLKSFYTTKVQTISKTTNRMKKKLGN